MHFVWWTALLLRLRRMLSRNELAVRLLGLPRETAHAQACGLVLIQIDGLSRRQLETAIAKRRMPFLHKLLHREHYRLTSLYSGIPSSTPSVQGELFYGVRCATPAFSFFSESLGRQVSMSEPEAAIEVESRIAVDRPGLLEGGSAYCDVYTGGAREAHFCAQNLGLGGFLASVRLSRLLVVATWYVWSLIRAAGLTLLEIALAIGGFVSGALRRGEFFAELGFIPARVAIVVLMRELVTIGATLDVARGVPIVHLNLLGYDEQAHRRGPESDFAHWTLKGIDHAVKTIWQAAHRSQLRHYDVWVYSDHGQETTTPYAQRHGQTIQQTVAKLLGEETIPSEPPAARSALTERAQWLGGGRIAQWLLGAKPFAADKSPTNPVKVVANGPVGFVYSRALGEEQRQRLAIRLVSERYCPLVLLPDTETSTWAYSADGVYHLPEDAAEVLGETHPFRDDVAMDLVRLANHVDAGSLVLCGWDKAGDSIAFPQQHGAHAGPGTEETHAFVTAPAELPLATVKRGYARPIELRQAVLDYFAKDTHTQIRAGADSSDSRVPVRVMTYNVHACVGMDNRLSIERIARVIARSRADIVALQELDAPRQRSGGVDQAREIARQLEMIHHFHPAWSCEEEQFGDAILSRHPVKLVKAGPLAAPRRPNGEPRGVLWVEVTVDGQPLQVLNTHLAVTPKDRLRQLESLVGDDWLGLAMATGPLVLCGDFNLGPTSSQYRVLSKRLIDTQVVEGLSPAQPTWLSWRPVTRIDHIFTTADLEVLDTYVVSNQLAKHASDHLPLVADLVLPIVQNTNVSASRICMASDEREI